MPEKETADWYKDYYAEKGANRNDILLNPGVLFQSLATQGSVIEALRSLPIDRGWRILDVGCGSGSSLCHFLGLGFAPDNLFGVDIIRDRVEQGTIRFPNLNLTCGNASEMAYAPNFFNLVLESTMFIQLTDETIADEIAKEMIRVVKPGGYVMVIDWRYSLGHPEYKAVSRTRIHRLFRIGTDTEVCIQTPGALIPPIGRFLSSHLPSAYFIIQRALPFLVGQVVTVLRKIGKPNSQV